jgi:hypothetical protein
MGLNDVMRAPFGVPVASKAVTAGGERIFELDGVNSGGISLVPARAISVGTRNGMDLKIATLPGDIAAGRYYSAVGGAKHTMQQIFSKQIYVQVSADDTVEAMPL